MASVYWSEKVLVRYKGGVASVTFCGSDIGVGETCGGVRRARQIGRRHWVRKETSERSSCASLCRDFVTTKVPRKGSQNLRNSKRD